MIKPADLRLVAGDAQHEPEVRSVLSAALGWGADQRYEQLYSWKHHENPFGRSSCWLAVEGQRVAGVRLYLQWQFDTPHGDRRAVRAIDTATHPDYQGQGIFTRLTLTAIEQEEAAGVDFVFNTPNEQSRPGYMKMGWSQIGRLPTSFRPTGLRGALRLATARTAADRWPAPCVDGDPASDVLSDPDLHDLIASQPAPTGIRTKRSVDFLRWRYPTDLLGYRAMLLSDSVASGIAIFRVRERGAAREIALGDVLVPEGDARLRRRLVAKVARGVDADYVLTLGPELRSGAGLLPLPGQGPIMTWRGLCQTEMPTLDRWQLRLGDIELF